jgi:ribokinase
VILDPAPAQTLPRSLLALVDLITPNEAEAAVLCGRDPSAPGDPAELAARLQRMTGGPVVLTLGADGVLAVTARGILRAPAVPVEAVDATAAGDTFNGALAVALAEGRPLGEAVRWANHAAALSVTRLGAQAAIPTRAEVERFLEDSSAPG